MSVEYMATQCPDCRGEGGGYNLYKQWEQCDQCDGTGKIPVRVAPDSFFARAKLFLFSVEGAFWFVVIVVAGLIVYLILKS